MNFNEPYLAYKELVKAREKAKNFKRVSFRNRILTLTRYKPNPKFGGYFISSTGSLNNNGRTWLTPITLKQFMEIELKDWDKVYFERGHIYNNFTRTVTTNNNTFGAYGSGADPKFYGSDSFIAATWTSEAGGYYSTPLATAPKWVFNPAGEAARQGQSDWIPVTSLGAGAHQRIFSSAILNPLNTVESLVNCKARFKEFNFRMSWEYVIGSYNTGTGEVSYNVDVVGAAVGMPMKLYGQKQFATLEGDWWYDDPNNKLWIKTASDPTGFDWRVCTQDYGLDLNQADTFTTTGLEFTQYYQAAIHAYRSNTAAINANIHDIRGNGLWIVGNSTGLNFAGEIARAGLNGVFLGAITTANFHDFSIHHIGQQGNEPWPTDLNARKHSGFGIAATDEAGETNKLPSAITVQDFTLFQVANIGIGPYGDNWLIEHFDIYEWASRFDDAGGIHPFYSNALGAGLSTKNGVVRNGMTHGGIGSHEGIANYAQLSLVCGIYFDAGTETWEVDNVSSFSNPQCGLLSNFNTIGTNVHDSRFFDNRGFLGQVFFYEHPDATFSPNFLNNSGNSFNSNTVVSAGGQYGMLTASDGPGFNAAYNPFSSGGSADNNTYFNQTKEATTSTNPVAINAFGKHASGVGNFASVQPTSTHTKITFATWKTRTSADASSTSAGFTLDNTGPTNSYDECVILYNPTGSSDFQDLPDGIYNDLAGVTLNDATVPAWGAVAAVIKPSYYFLNDGFTGTIGASITGRNPTVGNTWNVVSGTHTINSTSDVATSSNGLVTCNLGVSNYIVEAISYVTNTASEMRYDFRLANNTSSVGNRILLRFQSGNINVHEDSGSGLIQIGTSAFTLTTNTLYRVRIECNGSNIKVFVAGVQYINATTVVTSGTYAGFLGDTVRFTSLIVAYPL